MSTKINRWIFILFATIFVVAFGILSLPNQASAASSVDATSNSCFTCHEDLYYLHDLGKNYCITEQKDRCVNCHEGNANDLNKDASHLGLIAHPQKDDGAKCQECHVQDAQEHLATFASLGGLKTVLVAEPYTPSITAPSSLHDATEANPIVENWPWSVGTLVVFGLWILLVLFSPVKP
jgi:hypothetical protein